MKTRDKIIVAVIIILSVVLGAIMYAPKSRVNQVKTDLTALTARIDTMSNVVAGYYADADLRIGSLAGRMTAVESKTDTIRALAEKNERCITKHYKELRGLVETHGRKINDVVELVFKVAYGADWDKEGKKVFNQYELCGNQKLWDKVLKRLTPEQMQKVLKVHDLNERIAKLESQKTLKPARVPTNP